MDSRLPPQAEPPLPSHLGTRGALTGYLWLVYNSDAVDRLPPHPLLHGLVSGEPWNWNYNYTLEMARLEAHSDIAWDDVSDLVNRPSSDMLRAVPVIYQACGCVLLDFCDCSWTSAPESTRNEVIEISSDTSLYITGQNDEAGALDTASVGSNRQA